MAGPSQAAGGRKRAWPHGIQDEPHPDCDASTAPPPPFSRSVQFEDPLQRFKGEGPERGPPVDGERSNGPVPDNMNVKDWEPVLYAAGEVPYEALTVVHLVMEEKVQFGLLPKMPAMHLVWALAQAKCHQKQSHQHVGQPCGRRSAARSRIANPSSR